MEKMIAENKIWFGSDGNAFPAVKQYLSEVSGRRPSSLLLYEDYGHTDMAKKDVIKLFPDFENVPFDTPKPVKLIKMLARIGTDKDDLILDFFSGSATTAQSIFELNKEEDSHRRFILVQIPEAVNNNDEAVKKGLNTITEVGKERIRRCAKQLLSSQDNDTNTLFKSEKESLPIDTGFRVLKLDTSNMQDVYYKPEDSSEATLFEDNVKPDRSSEDLLFQVMLECNLPLSAKIERKTIAGKEVFNVNDGYLLACFDTDVNEAVITEVAKQKPYYFVMRDASLSSDNVADNFEQIFNAYSKDTIRKIL